MKAVLVGLGGFGSFWYELIRYFHRDIELAVVDADESKRAAVEADGLPFYGSLPEAIEKERPAFVINVTPKHVHASIDHIAFDHRLPVFSEKPIAGNYADALDVVERAEREGIPFMIGENYRAFVFSRKLKQLLDRGAIGDLHAIHGEFYRCSDKREGEPKENVLEELVVHHFDLIRYWTGREAETVFASFRSALLLQIELEGGATATFRCSNRSKGRTTDWAGDWRLEGSEGSLELTGGVIRLTKDGATVVYDDYKDVYAPGPLTEFLTALAMGREAETSARRYLGNQALAHGARQSMQEGRPVAVVSHLNRQAKEESAS